jgi:hypothetical protein
LNEQLFDIAIELHRANAQLLEIVGIKNAGWYYSGESNTFAEDCVIASG